MTVDKEDPPPKETDPLISKADGAPQGLDWDLGISHWILDLKEKAGYELLVILFFSQHLGRGVIDSLSANSANYIYKLYHVPATQVQIYDGIRNLPWALKPITGLVSDLCPIAGYNKAPYMAMVSVLGSAAFACVGVVPTSSLPIVAVVAMFFIQAMQLSTNDLLTEAKYAEKIRQVPSIGPGILTFVWIGMNVGGLIGTLFAGGVVEHHPKLPYVISACASVMILAPLMMGFMKETPMTDEELVEHRRRFAKEGEACFLSVMMFLSVATLTVCGLITGDPTVNAYAAIGVMCVMLAAVSLVLTPVIAKFTVFSMLQPALTLSTSGAGFYFFVDSPIEYPEGPHFTPFFYTSVVGTVGQVVSILGVMCYQRYLSTWRYRPLFIVANVVFTVVALLDVIVYTRANLSLGIPDHIFVLGTSVVQQLIFQWQWMPQVVLLSYLCPPGMEATMYALLAGCHNLGVAMSSTVGSFLLKSLDCEPNGSPNESAQFKNLWIASAISTVLPLITILLLINLVPDGRQGESLIEDSERTATEGSLWRRWRGLDTGTSSQV